jgi:hypothetical protein
MFTCNISTRTREFTEAGCKVNRQNGGEMQAGNKKKIVGYFSGKKTFGRIILRWVLEKQSAKVWTV